MRPISFTAQFSYPHSPDPGSTLVNIQAVVYIYVNSEQGSYKLILLYGPVNKDCLLGSLYKFRDSCIHHKITISAAD